MSDQPVIVNFPASEVIAAAEAAHLLLDFRHTALGHRVTEGKAPGYERCTGCAPLWDSLLTLINQGQHLQPRCIKCAHLYVEHGRGQDGCSFAGCGCPFSRDLMIPLHRLADYQHSLGYACAVAEKEET